MIQLKRVLEEKNITMKNCDAMLGMSEKTFYNKTSGQSEFLYSEIKKLSALFPEYNIDYLLSKDTRKNSA